eukprot:363917-Chlamydomonas_euryale.AAC.16
MPHPRPPLARSLRAPAPLAQAYICDAGLIARRFRMAVLLSRCHPPAACPPPSIPPAPFFTPSPPPSKRCRGQARLDAAGRQPSHPPKSTHPFHTCAASACEMSRGRPALTPPSASASMTMKM